MRNRKGDRFIFGMWKEERKINLSPFLSLLLISVILQWAIGCGGSDGKPIWTVMVYMAGDNNLSGALSNDLGEMEAVGSTGLVNVVVQMDTFGGAAKRFLVMEGWGRTTLLF
ncbi:MAG: hypothetical protein HZA18_01430 [Nitrospirae bacterium]|nr:hypothetical protein [Nitrospirota bacterium]